MRIFPPHAQYITYQPLKVLKESRLTKEDANTKIVPSYPHSEGEHLDVHCVNIYLN